MEREVLAPLDFNQNEIRQPVAHKLAGPPSDPVEGQFYYDSSSKVLYFHNGTTWIATATATGTDVASVNGESGVVVLDQDDIGDGVTYKRYSAVDKTKLAGIEALADVTDTANVDAAGALMESEIDTDLKTFALPANTTISTFGKSLVDDADASTARTTLGLVVGTDVEAHDADLTTIAGLTPSNDDVLQRKAGAWINRTPAQLKTDLALVKADVGLSNVLNTAQIALSDLDTDGTLAANLDSKVASQKATKTYVDSLVGTTSSPTFQALHVSDVNGIISLTAATDGGEYNLAVNTTGVLALYGVAGATLNVKLLDGYLELAALTATTVPYLDGNNRFASSAVTPTELGYLSGVTSAIQTQLGNKQPLDADLTTLAGLTATTDNFIVSVGSAWASRTPAQVRTTLGLVIGTDVQAFDADLTTWAGITPGAGIAAALAVNTGSAGAPVLFNGAGGTPSSLTLTNATGLPIAGLTGLAAGIAAFLATPSSANLATALTDETGSGANVFGTDPTITVTGGTGAINAIGQTALSLKDNTDTTKVAQFLMSSITTGTIRTYTLPNASGILALLATAQSWGAVQTFTLAPLVTLNNAATNTEVPSLTLTVNSSGVAATGLGSQLKFAMETTTTNTQDAAAVSAVWTDGTHATRTAVLKIYTVNNAAALAEVGRFTATGLTLGVAGTLLGRLTLSGNTSGTTILQPAAAASGTLTLPAATDTLVGLATADVLTNKTLTAPKLGSAGFIADANGNEVLLTVATVAAAVNEVTINNAATAGVPGFAATGGDANIHIQIIGKGNGLTKTSVLRQNDTTNSYKHNTVQLTGWGVFAQAAAANKSETVTFGITFAAIPIVLISYGGDQTGGVVALGNGGNIEKGPVAIKAYGETTGAFTAHAHTTDGTSWSATANVYYKWVAFGEL